VLALVLLIAVMATVGGIVAVVLGSHRRYNEVERFHRASRMTTEWARAGVTRPLIAEQERRVEERAHTDA